MATDGQGRVPDILLERYLAGDLSPEQRQQIEAERDASEEVRQRLDELEQERDAFLALDPPGEFAHRLAARLSVEAEAVAPQRRRWWAWILAPSAAAAATLVVTVTVVNMRGKAPSSVTSALEESELAGETTPGAKWPVAARPAPPQAMPATTTERDRGAERAGAATRDESPTHEQKRARAAGRRAAGRTAGARRLKDQAAGEAAELFGTEVGVSRVASGTGATPAEPMPEPESVPDADAAARDSAQAAAPHSAPDASSPPPAERPALVAESEAAAMQEPEPAADAAAHDSAQAASSLPVVGPALATEGEATPAPAAPREIAAAVHQPAPQKNAEASAPKAKPKRDTKKSRAGEAALPTARPTSPRPRKQEIGNDVRRVLRKKLPKLGACVEKSRKRGELPAELKNITLELTIAATGEVSRVVVAPEARVPKPLAHCLRKVLEPIAVPRSNEARRIAIPMRL